ncbi:hypothetical protein DES38_1029 [Streptohalobacillus salinus]|uniref:Uncharacterized protein n=1 Tax=Streptohalobacillus salinus TaxID=621096 RepID=A0A2V3WGD5_9BACI|nr:hypothetical protein [Streptohalobacillus salinus]PXW92431.1 hypothetical protein DES38_1029 [Streptohalobacillus salinus]
MLETSNSPEGIALAIMVMVIYCLIFMLIINDSRFFKLSVLLLANAGAIELLAIYSNLSIFKVMAHLSLLLALSVGIYGKLPFKKNNLLALFVTSFVLVQAIGYSSNVKSIQAVVIQEDMTTYSWFGLALFIPLLMTFGIYYLVTYLRLAWLKRLH